MMFAVFGLGWAELVVLGMCGGGLAVGLGVVLFAFVLSGPRAVKDVDDDTSAEKRSRKSSEAAEDD
jgi:hypothetical protein